MYCCIRYNWWIKGFSLLDVRGDVKPSSGTIGLHLRVVAGTTDLSSSCERHILKTLTNIHLTFSPATDRIFHVCAALLPSQPNFTATQDPWTMLLPSILGAFAQNGAFYTHHASPECCVHQGWIHVRNNRPKDFENQFLKTIETKYLHKMHKKKERNSFGNPKWPKFQKICQIWHRIEKNKDNLSFCAMHVNMWLQLQWHKHIDPCDFSVLSCRWLTICFL